jgi:hypothetical protein
MTRKMTRVVLSILLVFVFAAATAGLAEAKPVTLATPVPLTPANNTEFTNVPRVTTLQWFPVEGAVSYTVTLDYSANGKPGTYLPVADFTGGTGITNPSLQLTAADFAGTLDGFYAWTVQAIGNDTDILTGKATKPHIFQFSTTKTLETPARSSPPNGVFLFDTTDLTQVLTWDSRPAVASSGGSTPSGYNVYIEENISGTWTPVAGSPFNVALSSPTGWQDSSYKFVAPGAGEYRWAVVALGDGTLAVDSPTPSDSKSKDWWEFTFTAP